MSGNGENSGGLRSGHGRLVLASSSPRRIELLKNLGVSFEVMASKIEEKIDPSLSFDQVVLDLACAKAREVAQRMSAEEWQPRDNRSSIIVGGDTIVVLDESVLGQPKNKQDAFRMLALLSGRCHTVYTGVTVLKFPEQEILTGFQTTKVYMKTLMPAEIEEYIDTGEPMDKAGSYALQGIGSAFVEKIEGCYTNVIGLPVPLVVRLLRQMGVKILGC